MGLDRKETLGKHETGSRAAVPIWLQFMKAALSERKVTNFPKPPGVVYMKIDPRNGLLASDETVGGIFEVFKEGREPEKFSLPPAPRPADFYRFDL